MKTDTIIFLGAGASAADGAPTQNSLFKSYFQRAQDHDQIDTNLHAFFRDFFDRFARTLALKPRAVRAQRRPYSAAWSHEPSWQDV